MQFGSRTSLSGTPDSNEDTSFGFSRSIEDSEMKTKCLKRLERKPHCHRNLAHLAMLYDGSHEFVDLCRRHTEKYFQNPQVFVAVGKALLQLKELTHHNQALHYLKIAQNSLPNNPEVLYQIGCALVKIHGRNGREEAFRYHSWALHEDPQHIGALTALGDHYRKNTDYSQAIGYYEKANHMNVSKGKPPSARLFYKMGEAMVKDGKGSQGRSYLRTSIEGSCADSEKYVFEANLMIALSYLTEERFNDALQHCDKATPQHPRHRITPSPLSSRLLKLVKGSAYLRSGDYEKCVATLKQEADIGQSGENNDPELLHDYDSSVTKTWDEEIDNLLGLAHTLRIRHSLAKRHLEAAKLRCGVTPRPTILVNIAYLYQLQGKSDQAMEVLEQCLSLCSDFPMALLRMGYLLLCDDQWYSAIQYLQKCTAQPWGTLTFGESHHGAAHFYLCIANHFLEHGQNNLTQVHGPSREEFQKGMHHRKDLRDLQQRDKLEFISAKDLAQREPLPRASLDLTEAQAKVLLLYARDQLNIDGPQCDSDSDSENHNNEALDGGFDAVPLGSSVQDVAVEMPRDAKLSPPLLTDSASTNASSGSGMFPSRETSNPALSSGSTRSLGASRNSDRVVSGVPSPFTNSLAELEARLPHNQRVRMADLEMSQCLASGAFGTVYCGKYFFNDREVSVVVKRLHVKDGTYDEQTGQELQAEIAILSTLSHPRLVRFVGACLKAPDIACVTEYAPGGNLHNAIHVLQYKFAREVRFQLSVDLLEGVSYMHTRSPPVAHFDIKTLNLVLDAMLQRLQICDFGLARSIGGDSARDRPLRRGGSPRYMAPECLEGSSTPLTERADIWSSGCVLLELFGEVLPYAECLNAQQILKMMLVHQQGPTICSSIEAGMRDIIADMLHFNTLERCSIEVALQRVRSIGGLDSRLDQSHQAHQSRFLWIP